MSDVQGFDIDGDIPNELYHRIDEFIDSNAYSLTCIGFGDDCYGYPSPGFTWLYSGKDYTLDLQAIVDAYYAEVARPMPGQLALL